MNRQKKKKDVKAIAVSTILIILILAAIAFDVYINKDNGTYIKMIK